jgi:ABC-type transporter Mla subunit MlaD
VKQRRAGFKTGLLIGLLALAVIAALVFFFVWWATSIGAIFPAKPS